MEIEKQLLMDIINDFNENPPYKFSITEYKLFEGPEYKNMIYISLFLNDFKYQQQNMNVVITEIKKRIKNVLSLDRVILKCNINTEMM
jgi:hypothetical protein